jgi:preprotein translocase subunit SecA
MGVLEKIFRIDARALKTITRKAEPVFNYEKEMEALSDEEIKAKTPYFKELLKDPEITIDDILPEVFAVAREAARRVIGQYPYPVQVFGATVLNEGDVAEMKTGEGKTLTAIMAVYLNALEGKGVHVVTVNEYLALRDAEWMGAIYRFLGLTVGVNLREKNKSEKKEAYLCDITYTTNSEVGFDYLRDNMATQTETRVLRGLHYAIVDEADSILIDESRTPLIISGGSGITANSYEVADRIVKSLRKDKDFSIEIKKKAVSLTDSGIDKIQKAFGVSNLYDPQYSDLVHRVQQALKANFIFTKDVEYMVKEDEIHLVDSFTGRVLEGREYSDGLQQAIQAKEHVKIKSETVTMATITYQNFFRLYDKLAGMTGTAKTEEEEFRKIYNMRVVVIPTNRPIVRDDMTDIVFGSETAKYKALLEDIKQRHEKGQPLLIGTPSVEKSEIVDKVLTTAGLPHEVLNAKNHAREAHIIEHAGEKGSITIATNMAGRGTDIKISEEVKKLGGLAVIGTERHESRRIDNQLRGRSGRQGDPGYSRFYVCIEDDLMKRFASPTMFKMFDQMGDECIESKTMCNLITSAQRKVEGQNFDTRKTLLDYDDVLSKQREIMYNKRDEILFSATIKDTIHEYFELFAHTAVKSCTKIIDQEVLADGPELIKYLVPKYLNENNIQSGDVDELPVEEVEDFITALFSHLYAKRRKSWSDKTANYVEKTVVLQMTDKSWTKHIDTMAKLREGIYLRSYANTNPLQSYTNEGFELFKEMGEEIAANITSSLFRVKLKPNEQKQPNPAGDKANAIDVKTKKVESFEEVGTPIAKIKPIKKAFPASEVKKAE